jgi:hypothetical protein
MRSASRATLIRSSSGMVGTTPPASRRDSAGWVMPARVGVAGGDLDVPEVDAGVEHGRDEGVTQHVGAPW